MNKKKIIILILSLVIVFSVAGYSIAEKEAKSPSEVTQTDTNEVQYELIMNAFLFENKIFKPNAALLLSDKKEIKEDAKIFLAKTKIDFKCGYHYRFLFWTNKDSLLGVRLVNEECEISGETFSYKPEEACIKLANYIKKLETAPTHYIYSLEIPVSMKPNEVREKLKDSKLNIFFIDDEKARFPSIEFMYRYVHPIRKNADWVKVINSKECEEAAREKIEEFVDKVKSRYLVVNELRISFMGNGKLVDSAYRNGYVNLMFEGGTDLSDVVKFLEQEGVKIKKQNNPSTYLVQVVDTSADIKYIEDKLKKYEFIKEITEYKKNYK